MEAMVASPPRREHAEEGLRVVADVSGRSSLWFSVAEHHAGLIGDRSDHVLIGLLMPAMKEGRDLHVGGIVTDSLLHQANGDLQHLLRLVLPDLREIAVTADSTAAPAPKAAGVATGFSGGVDSFATLAEYFWAEDVPASLRVTHLLNNNVGAHGHGSDADALWRVRRAPLERAAAEFGLPFVVVDSNLDDHYPTIGFIQSVTMRNAAVAHLLSAGIGQLHVSSTVTFRYVGVGVSDSIARVDPMLVPLVSTSAVTLSSANSGLTRVQKVLSLVGRAESRYLDVCTNGDPHRTRNCSACEKCMRTMLMLEMGGHLREFCPEVFSMDPYLRGRDGYIARVLSSEDHHSPEFLAYAEEIGWRWRISDRVRAAVRIARTRASRLAHRAAALPLARPLRRMLRR